MAGTSAILGGLETRQSRRRPNSRTRDINRNLRKKSWEVTLICFTPVLCHHAIFPRKMENSVQDSLPLRLKFVEAPFQFPLRCRLLASLKKRLASARRILPAQLIGTRASRPS